jgi:hypothetical protein
MIHFTSEILSLSFVTSKSSFVNLSPDRLVSRLAEGKLDLLPRPRLHDNLMPGKLNSKFFPISLQMNPNAMLKSGRKFHCIIHLMQNVYPRR